MRTYAEKAKPFQPGAGRIAVQPKLTIRASGDADEQEADQTAELVTRMQDGQVKGGPGPSIQRKVSGNSSPPAVPATVNEVIQQPGHPLDRSTRAFMESRFAHDFSRVRVHVDARAAQSAQDVNADAYTVGHNVVFGTGRFQPASPDGRRLLAHELTHVVQQGAGVLRPCSSWATSTSPPPVAGTVQRQTSKAPEAADVAPIRNDKIVYTCNCGWIDKAHATDTTSYPTIGARNLWKRIQEESGTSLDEKWYVLDYRQDAVLGGKVGGPKNLLTVPSQSGSIIPGAPPITLPGIDWTIDFPRFDLRLYPGIVGHYQVQRGLSVEQKKSVALAIFQEVSRAFETFQSAGWILGKGTSSFSEEDLVSNLIGFYSAVESIPFEECLALCAPVSKADSEAVLSEHGAPGSKKNKSFQPVLYPCKACAAAGVFPAKFQTIQPAEEGKLYQRIDLSTTITR